ncbi:MAG TPA: M48 family metalloprotease [Candidatus Saccharibacteria bacterium]|nr:M48 family metalloprotease [Candidatus Saccharibacteria bacterium]
MYSEISANKRKTVFMMFMFIILVSVLGWIFGQFFNNQYLTYYVLIGALVYVLISYFNSSKMALGLNKAREISKKDNPRLFRIVENLAITDGLPTPKIYVIDDKALNAFATGRDPEHSSVAVTTGLLEVLDDQELEGVMAHELGHVKNYDIRVSMIVFALVAVVAIISDIMIRSVWFRDTDEDNQAFFLIGILIAVLAPIAAMLIQLSISRKREYLADATGALTTRYPEGLASALEKLKAGGTTLRAQNKSTAHLFFANPLKKGGLSNLFSTHPPIDDRIKRLNEMGGRQ